MKATPRITGARILKTVAMAAGGLAACALLAWVAVQISNRNDQAPSAAATALARVAAQGPLPAAEDNGYLYLMGLDAPADQDPAVYGAQRSAAIAHAAADGSLGTLRQSDDSYRTARSAQVAGLHAACGLAGQACRIRLRQDPDAAAAWLAAEPALLARYQQLLARQGWRDDAAGYHGEAPLPPFALASDGQSLHFLQAWQKAGSGDAAAVRQMIAADLRFWRTLHAMTGKLLHKMVAVAALKRHFAWSVLVLQRLPAQSQAAAIPAAWRAPFKLPERSMRRVFAGEVMRVEAMLRQEMSHQKITAQVGPLRALFTPAYQVQQGLNPLADYLLAMATALEVEYPLYVDAAGRARRIGLKPAAGLPLGQDVVDMVPYANRTADLEGIRRLYLLVAILRAVEIGREALPAALEAAPAGLRNPYTGKAFEWDAASGAIIFTGSEPGPAGRHAVML